MLSLRKRKADPGLKRLDGYLATQFSRIEGWCNAHLFGGIAACHQYQRLHEIDGPVAEIGVYHGKFFIALASLKTGAGIHHAIDVFDMQEFNLDGAGKGNLSIFRTNCNNAGFAEGDIATVRADSMALKHHDLSAIRSVADEFSMFSVDGCHRVEHTINDIRIAMKLTSPGGIIYVDDYYNAHWPGVQEGVAKLYFFETPRFVPLLFSSNKLFLCHISRHESYLDFCRSFLLENYSNWRFKEVERFGYNTITLSPDIKEPFVLRY